MELKEMERDTQNIDNNRDALPPNGRISQKFYFLPALLRLKFLVQ